MKFVSPQRNSLFLLTVVSQIRSVMHVKLANKLRGERKLGNRIDGIVIKVLIKHFQNSSILLVLVSK